MNKYTEPHFNTSALITIDTQNDFTLDGSPFKIEGTLDVIANMVRLLRAFRQQELTVIHVVRLYHCDGSNAELCRKQVVEEGAVVAAPGSQGAELVVELKPDQTTKLDAEKLLSGELQQIGENEFVMYKPRWGAFYKTALEEFLQARDIDTLVFCGCNYPNCPRTSIYEASERDFRVVLASDALSGLYAKGEDEMKNIGVSLMRTDEIENMLV
jgi:nicotinamidase-related amidase